MGTVYENTSDGRAAMGIRTSNNKTMSIQICAGLSVFVCDNLVFRGDLIALNRKHTSGLNLCAELSVAVLRFQDHFGRLTGEIDRLRARVLTDPEAKALIHDVFVGGVLPVRFLPQVSEMYFAPPFQEWAGRNAWSLHNAFTAAAPSRRRANFSPWMAIWFCCSTCSSDSMSSMCGIGRQVRVGSGTGTRRNWSRVTRSVSTWDRSWLCCMFFSLVSCGVTGMRQ